MPICIFYFNDNINSMIFFFPDMTRGPVSFLSIILGTWYVQEISYFRCVLVRKKFYVDDYHLVVLDEGFFDRYMSISRQNLSAPIYLGFPLFQLQLQLYLVGKKMNINPNNKNRQQKEI